MRENNNEDEKVKGIKNCVINLKPKSKDFKSCLEAAPIESETNNLEKDNLNVDDF